MSFRNRQLNGSVEQAKDSNGAETFKTLFEEEGLDPIAQISATDRNDSSGNQSIRYAQDCKLKIKVDRLSKRSCRLAGDDI